MVKKTFQYTLTKPRRRLMRLPSPPIKGIEGKSGTWLVPSIEDAKACKNIGWRWDKEHNVCMAVEGIDGGWTAPIKGAYFSYGILDMYEATGESKLRGKYLPQVSGCLVADSSVYPMFAGMCRPIYEGEYYDEQSRKRETLNDAKRDAMEIAGDVLKGDADNWGMDYYSTFGKKIKHDAEDAVVSNSPNLVVDVFRKGRREQPLTEFGRRRNAR